MAQWQALPQGLDRKGRNDFAGGYNSGRLAFDLKDNESTDETGWDTDKYPALSTREGRTTYGASGAATTRLLTNFKDTHLVRAVGTTLQYYNGTAWTNITGTFANVDWDSANFDISGAALILTNGTDNVKYWNGTVLADLNATTAPKGKYIAADNRRVYIAKGDVVNYSAFQNATDWTTAPNAGAVQFYTANGGDITGLKSFGGHICVFKKDAFAEIFHTGDSRATHRLVEASNDIGCDAYKTIQEVGAYLFWKGPNDVYMYAGGMPKSIGQPIRALLDSINAAYSDQSFAWTDGIRYYLCLVTGSNTAPDTEVVFDPRYGTWRIRNKSLGGLRYSATLNNQAYAGDINGQTYKLNDGTTDNGTAISWSVTSKPYDDGEPDAEKEWSELHIQAYLPTGSTMTVSVSTDDRNSIFTDVYTATAADTSQNMSIIVPLDTVNISPWLRYKLSGTGKVEVFSVTRYFRIQPIQH